MNHVIPIRRTHLKRIFISLTIIIGMAALVSCGFQPRNAADIPPQLRVLYLDLAASQQQYHSLFTQLRNMLTSLNVVLVDHRSEAPYTLSVTHVTFLHTQASLTTSNLLLNLLYSLSVRIEVLNASGKAVTPPKTIRVSQSMLANVSQIFLSERNTLLKQELSQDIISEIYYFLISSNLGHALSLSQYHDHHAKYQST